MKRNNLFIAALFGISLTSCAQRKIEFANEFKPNSEYVVSTKSEIKTEITFEASEEFIKQVEANGMKNPHITEETSNMKIAFIAGSEENGFIPIEIKYLETGKPQTGFIRSGESVQAKYSMKDKIIVTELPDESRLEMDADQIMAMMSDGFSNDLFKSDELSVGDSVTLSSPITMPIGPYQIVLTIENTYVLKSIDSDKAYFDIFSTCVLVSDYPEISLNASGGGTGDCIYDFNQKRILSKNTELTLIMNTEMQKDVKMSIILDSKTLETTEIK